MILHKHTIIAKTEYLLFLLAGKALKVRSATCDTALEDGKKRTEMELLPKTHSEKTPSSLP